MAVRCAHRNVIIFEHVHVWHEREGVDGAIEADGVNTEGSISGYTVKCRDCGRRWGGPRRNHRMPSVPRWVRDWIDKLHASDIPRGGESAEGAVHK